MHAQQHVLCGGFLGNRVVGVVGDHQRNPELLVQVEQASIYCLVVGVAVILQLQEIVLAKDFPVPPSGVTRSAEIAFENGPRRLAAVARAQRDQAVGVLGEQGAVDARLVIVALEARP